MLCKCRNKNKIEDTWSFIEGGGGELWARRGVLLTEDETLPVLMSPQRLPHTHPCPLLGSSRSFLQGRLALKDQHGSSPNSLLPFLMLLPTASLPLAGLFLTRGPPTPHSILPHGTSSLLVGWEQTRVLLSSYSFSSQSPFCQRILLALPSARLEVSPFLLTLPGTCCLDFTGRCFCP